MKLRTLVATSALLMSGLVAAPAVTTAAAGSDFIAARVCTKTSSGTCIRGGQFCPQSKYGLSGYDARGSRWVCKGDRTHPHWLRP